MDNELFPTHETPPPPPPRKEIIMKFLLRKKVLLLSSISLMMIGMGTYILVAPAEEKLDAVAQYVEPTPTVTPIPTDIPLVPTSSASATPLPPTATPTITLTPTPTIPPGTSWRIYSNTQYGYRIKYPPDWSFRDLSPLEPLIPHYLAYNPTVATGGARFITIATTTRTYEEQLALGASSSAITVAGIKGTKQYFSDSDGNTSTVVILPRSTDLLVLRAKTKYLTTFDFMLSTLNVTKK